MRHILMTAGIATLAFGTVAQAGGLAPVVVPDVVVVPAEPTSSVSNAIVPLVVLGLLVAVSSGGDSSSPVAGTVRTGNPE